MIVTKTNNYSSTKIAIPNRPDLMLFGYSLHSHQNTAPGCNHGSWDRSGVLWDVCGL